MNMRATLLSGALATVVAVPASAQDSPRFSVSFDIGTEQGLTGDLHGAGFGSVLNLPTQVEARGFGDVYERPANWAVSAGYHVTPGTELRARYFRASGDATEVQVGTVAGLPLFAEFDGYSSQGVDVGVRQYFGSRIQPYVGASAGYVNVETIDSTFSVPAASVVLPDVAMLADSTVPTAAFSAGLVVPVGGNFAIQGGFDVRWTDDLDPIDGLAGTGLESINDETRSWTMPITAGVLYRF